jgi:hypothetical protein
MAVSHGPGHGFDLEAIARGPAPRVTESEPVGSERPPRAPQLERCRDSEPEPEYSGCNAAAVRVGEAGNTNLTDIPLHRVFVCDSRIKAPHRISDTLDVSGLALIKKDIR